LVLLGASCDLNRTLAGVAAGIDGNAFGKLRRRTEVELEGDAPAKLGRTLQPQLSLEKACRRPIMILPSFA